MDLKQAGSSLDSIVSSFNARIVELQELAIARNMYPAASVPDLSGVDQTLKAMESQIQSIRGRLQDEMNAVPKAKKIIELSLRQQRKLQHMLAHIPSAMHESLVLPDQTPSHALIGSSHHEVPFATPGLKEQSISLPKEKKVRCSAPRWYVTSEELDSLSSYMRGRLTFDKVNIAINEIATLADANSQLITAPKKKLSEDIWEKALELRDIAMAEALKGKHFLLETDIKGPGLKLDNTGKAVLTVLRHLGRIQETRIGRHRVIALMKAH